MQKRMTITLDAQVYDALNRRIGKQKISRFIENLVRPHVLDDEIEAGYQAMAADEEREKEAQEWCNALAGEASHETR